jgi:hypothetical protein
MTKVLASLLVILFVISVTAAAVSAEPVVVKEKKIMAMDSETGKIKAAKGIVINRETGATQADIEMIMKYLGDE